MPKTKLKKLSPGESIASLEQFNHEVIGLIQVIKQMASMKIIPEKYHDQVLPKIESIQEYYDSAS